MGKGIVISTRLSRIIRSSTLKMYPTDVDESIVCVWRKKNPNQAVEKFARLLQKVYGELEAQRAEQAPAT